MPLPKPGEEAVGASVAAVKSVSVWAAVVLDCSGDESVDPTGVVVASILEVGAVPIGRLEDEGPEELV